MEILLFIGLIVGAAFFVNSFAGSNQGKPTPRVSNRGTTGVGKKTPAKNGPHNNWGLSNPSNQIEAISKVNFERVRILNKSEYRVFVALEKIVENLGDGHRVLAQTSLGELIKPDSKSGDWKERKAAFASINSKRLDFAVIDKFGLLTVAVEYQGKGHHQDKAFARDAVKREALRRAGVPMIEVAKGTMPSELRAEIAKYIDPQG